MIIILADALLLLITLGIGAFIFREVVKQNKRSKIQNAVERQKEVKEQLKLVKEINAEEILENENKVKTTLSKLQ